MKEILKNLTPQQRREHYIKKEYYQLYLEIEKFNKKNTNNLIFAQKIYHYFYSIIDVPKCVICNTDVKFKNFNTGYNIYCSKKCLMSDSDIIKKRNKKSKQTKKEKYGDENYNNLKKIEETNLKKYGVKYFTQTDEFKEKSKQTNLEKYNLIYFTQTDEFKEKREQINLKKYGVKYFTQTDEFKEKSKQTKKEKYGNENYNNLEKQQETNLVRYGHTHHMSHKKKNNLLYDFSKKSSFLYYSNLIKKNPFLSHDYILLDNETNILKIKHINCNNIFKINKQLFYLRIKHNHDLCTFCNKLHKNISYTETEILNYIKDNYDGEIITSDKKILDGLELDIYLPDLNLAFEFNGLYWHSEVHKDKMYHLNKTNMCLKQDIQLIHVWEDDWHLKQDVVKSMILNKIGKTPKKIYGRKTEIKDLSDKKYNKLIKDFLNENHLQGFVGSKVKLGLFYDDDLVSLMTFGKKRLFMKSQSKTENEYELLRFCNKLNTNVIGGASKLFKYFIHTYNPKEIITYADRSHSQGKLYDTLGFEFIHKTKPNYFYILDGIRKHRFSFRKDILVKHGFDKNMTEHEIMLSRNIYRIYDSGSMKFTFK